MFPRASIHSAKNSTGDLNTHTGVSTYKDPDHFKLFQLNKLIIKIRMQNIYQYDDHYAKKL